MKKNILLAVQCLLLIVLSSCVREDLEVGKSYCYVGVDFSYGDDQTKTSVTVDPLDIENVQLFAFSSQTGSLLYYDTNAGQLAGQPVTLSTNKINSISWCLPVGVKMDIYAVANWSELPLYETIDELTSSDQLVFTIESLEELNKMSSLPMTSNKLFTCTGNGEKLNLKMRKYFDKYKLNLDFTESTGSILSVKVKNANGVIKLFSNNAASSTNQILSEFDYSSAADLTADYITLIVPENRQTQVNGAQSDKKDLLEINADPTFPGSDKCTYMSIDYINCWNQQRNNIVYFGNGLNNYDVKGGYETTINVNMAQFEPDPEFDFQTGEIYLYEAYEERIDFTYKYMDISEDMFSVKSISYGWPTVEITDIVIRNDGTGYVQIKGEWSDIVDCAICFEHPEISKRFDDISFKVPKLSVEGPSLVLTGTPGNLWKVYGEFTWPYQQPILGKSYNKIEVTDNLQFIQKSVNGGSYSGGTGTNGIIKLNGTLNSLPDENYYADFTIQVCYWLGNAPTIYDAHTTFDITVYWASEFSLSQEMIFYDRSIERYVYHVNHRRYGYSSTVSNTTVDYQYHNGSAYSTTGELTYEYDLDEGYNPINLRQQQNTFTFDTEGLFYEDGRQYPAKSSINVEFEASRIY